MGIGTIVHLPNEIYKEGSMGNHHNENTYPNQNKSKNKNKNPGNVNQLIKSLQGDGGRGNLKL